MKVNVRILLTARNVIWVVRYYFGIECDIVDIGLTRVELNLHITAQAYSENPTVNDYLLSYC